MVDMLIERGFDVNAGGVNLPDGPLGWAVDRGHLAVARTLLEHGALLRRLLIGAINANTNSYDLVKLLVEQGANVNQVWRFGDEDRGPLFNALSWAVDSGREDIADYLRARGGYAA